MKCFHSMDCGPKTSLCLDIPLCGQWFGNFPMLSGISGLVLQDRRADGHGIEPACQPSMSSLMGINSTCLASWMEESVTFFFNISTFRKHYSLPKSWSIFPYLFECSDNNYSNTKGRSRPGGGSLWPKLLKAEGCALLHFPRLLSTLALSLGSPAPGVWTAAPGFCSQGSGGLQSKMRFQLLFSELSSRSGGGCLLPETLGSALSPPKRPVQSSQNNTLLLFPHVLSFYVSLGRIKRAEPGACASLPSRQEMDVATCWPSNYVILRLSFNLLLGQRS